MEPNLELNLTEKQNSESRRYPRVDVDSGTLIEFSLQNEDFQPLYKAFIIDYSLRGCGIITVNKGEEIFKENDLCYVKVPEESHVTLKTKIIWVKKIENKVFRLGLEYID